MIVNGPFDVKMNPEPPFDVLEGVALARATFDKRFHGSLDATSKVHFMSARSPASGAAYVALERVSGSLDGQSGTFVLVHLGFGDSSEQWLKVLVVPDSGTGALKGLRGSMKIEIREGGAHFYQFDYTLER